MLWIFWGGALSFRRTHCTAAFRRLGTAVVLSELYFGSPFRLLFMRMDGRSRIDFFLAAYFECWYTMVISGLLVLDVNFSMIPLASFVTATYY
jgi:hypothetical protein